MSGMNYLDVARSVVLGTYATGAAAAAVLGWLLYWATVPFCYLAYYLWAVLSFVLSPLWFLVDLVRSSTVVALHLAVRFRVSSPVTKTQLQRGGTLAFAPFPFLSY